MHDVTLLKILSMTLFPAVLLAASPTPFGKTLPFSGNALRINANGNSRITKPIKLFDGDEIETGKKGGLKIKLENGTEIVLGALCRVKMVKPSRTSIDTLQVKRGKLRANVQKSKTGRYSLILLGQKSGVGVRGTRLVFDVADNGNQREILYVAEGAVDLAQQRIVLQRYSNDANPEGFQGNIRVVTLENGEYSSFVLGQDQPREPVRISGAQGAALEQCDGPAVVVAAPNENGANREIQGERMEFVPESPPQAEPARGADVVIAPNQDANARVQIDRPAKIGNNGNVEIRGERIEIVPGGDMAVGEPARRGERAEIGEVRLDGANQIAGDRNQGQHLVIPGQAAERDAEGRAQVQVQQQMENRGNVLGQGEARVQVHGQMDIHGNVVAPAIDIAPPQENARGAHANFNAPAPRNPDAEVQGKMQMRGNVQAPALQIDPNDSGQAEGGNARRGRPLEPDRIDPNQLNVIAPPANAAAEVNGRGRLPMAPNQLSVLDNATPIQILAFPNEAQGNGVANRQGVPGQGGNVIAPEGMVIVNGMVVRDNRNAISVQAQAEQMANNAAPGAAVPLRPKPEAGDNQIGGIVPAPSNGVANRQVVPGQVGGNVIAPEGMVIVNGMVVRDNRNAISVQAQAEQMGRHPAGNNAAVLDNGQPPPPVAMDVRIAPDPNQRRPNKPNNPLVLVDELGPDITPVPPGVDPQMVSLPAEVVRAQIEEAFEVQAPPQNNVAAASPESRPNEPEGGYINLLTGEYIPPPPGSAYDPISQLYIPPPSLGQLDPTTGEFRPSSQATAPPPSGQASMASIPLPPGQDPGQEDTPDRGLASVATEPEPTASNPQTTIIPVSVPRFDPTLCPPYCNPLGPPGTKSGNYSTNVSIEIQ